MASIDYNTEELMTDLEILVIQIVVMIQRMTIVKVTKKPYFP